MAKIIPFMANTAISFRNRRLIVIHENNQAVLSELRHELFKLAIMRCFPTPF